MYNLKNDIIKFLKLSSSQNWNVELGSPLKVLNQNTYGKPAVKIQLISFGPNSAMINSPTIENQSVPSSSLSFNERDTIKLMFRMEILH